MSTQDRGDDIARFDAMFRAAPGYVPGIDPEVQRRRRIRRLAATGIALAVALGLAGGYVALALTAPLAAPESAIDRPTTVAGPPAALAMPPTGLSAVSVSGADPYLGAGANASTGGDGTAPMASISKLITAMVILDRKPLGASDTGPTITFSKADHDLYDAYFVRNATIAPMPTGLRMTEHDALATILIPSASNYAEAVSTWACGSQSAFLSAARAWLAKHGLTHTRMVEPTGLDARNVSSTADLIALGKLAAADPVISAIVATPTLDVPGIDPMPGTNQLLGTDGVNGIKTGTLEGYGSNLLYSATLDVGLDAPLTVVGVELGGMSAGTTDDDAVGLLESLKSGFHPVTLTKAGQRVGTFTTEWGAKATAVYESHTSVLTWSDAPITPTASAVELGSGRDGERIGTVTWTTGTEKVTTPIVLKGSIRPPSTWWRLSHPAVVLRSVFG